MKTTGIIIAEKKYPRGINHWNYKGGITGICGICGGITARKKAKKCVACYHKSRFKNPLTEDGKYTHKKGNCIECNKVISDVHRNLFRSCSHKGERSCKWKGGITPEMNKIRTSIENKLWRNAVLARDGYTCQYTGKIGGNMEVHHIQNFSQYPELRFAIDNGITLTKKSHADFHKLYGKQNNT